jgi:tRNA modification GTPase
MHRLLHPPEVVIAGPPNVGKSALTNALVGREVSIVSDTPGTTRDWVRHLTQAEGVPVWLTDTAGLWEWERSCGRGEIGGFAEQAAAVEAEAVRRAWERAESADLVVCLVAGPWPRSDPLIARLLSRGNVLRVSGKCDLLPADREGDLAVSARTLTGLDDLRRAICRRLGFADFDPCAAMAFTERQANLLRTAAAALCRRDFASAVAALRDLLAGKVERSPESAPDCRR